MARSASVGPVIVGWSLLEKPQDTKLAALAADPARYRGTIVCTRGTLRERDSLDAILEVDRTNGWALRVRVTFVHADMGAPLRQPARVCGVLTGGLSEFGAKGVEIVGMLDTPSSRAWVPLEPRVGEMDGEPRAPSGSAKTSGYEARAEAARATRDRHPRSKRFDRSLSRAADYRTRSRSPRES